MRAALYARHSSDQQRAASIEDQFRVCRERAARAGWKVAGEYEDSAVSGASMILRRGVQALLEDARRGLFEIVVAEALDRVSRDQADVATLYKHLRFAGVTVVTLAEGEVSELHVGLKGTMNALFLKDLAAKTHRGLRGRVEQGRSGGGLCYGYDVTKSFDGSGDPVRGGRTVNETEAGIVRRVFREFADGASPRSFARRLNGEGVPGPSGRLWTDSTVRGHAKRGTGLINNELYVGRLVWNRLRYVKNPETGKRVSRINPPEEWIVTEVPDLRIVDDGLWQAVKDRQGEITERYATVIEATSSARANRLNGTHRPRHLLSGLLKCGVCGGPYAMRGQDRYGCSGHVMTGSCPNGRGIRRVVIKERVLSGLKDRLKAPEVAAEAMRGHAEESNRINRERRATGASDRKELADVERRIAAMIAVIEDGGYVRGTVDRLRELEARQDELNERLSAAPADLPDIHPNVADVYRRKVARLAEALDHPEDRDAAAAAIRSLIDRIVLNPGSKRGEMDAVLHDDLGTILESAGTGHGNENAGTSMPDMSVSVVAGAGLEPAILRLQALWQLRGRNDREELATGPKAKPACAVTFVMRPDFHQPVEALAVDQRLEIRANVDIGRRLAGRRIPLDSNRMLRTRTCLVTEIGHKGQRLSLAFACNGEINGHEWRVIDGDPHFLDGCDQHIAIPVLPENCRKQPHELRSSDWRAKIEPRAVPCNPHVEIAAIGRIPEVDRRQPAP